MTSGKKWIFSVYLLFMLLSINSNLYAVLKAEDVLLVINQNSPTSIAIANMYRQYYPSITNDQVVYLNGIPDSSGPSSTAANEIISRTDFNNMIATPIRSHLQANNAVNSTKVIITTAGLPYRIEDTNNPNIVNPGSGSVYSADDINKINAASVESELSVLFQLDPSLNNTLNTANRVANPYQAYRSGMDKFARDIETNLQNIQWTETRSVGSYYGPTSDGTTTNWGTSDRKFSAGDIYITSRLDAGKDQGKDPTTAVWQMLESSRRASDINFGVNGNKAIVVLDDSHGINDYDLNRVYNLDGSSGYNVFEDGQNPPNTANMLYRDDYKSAYTAMTGEKSIDQSTNSAKMIAGNGVTVILDTQSDYEITSKDVTGNMIAWASFGTNGDDGKYGTYITNALTGDDAFNLANGAVFTSIESFNGVTMFNDVYGSQGKVINFLSNGGAGAIGHTFEPFSDAVVDNEYLFYNLLADHDGDGFADMSFGEAAFTALPYLSWSEVVLGDPLMTIAYGNGGSGTTLLIGDVNLDNIVSQLDISIIESLLGNANGDAKFNPLGDLDFNSEINGIDLQIAQSMLGNYLTLNDSGVYQVVPEPTTIILLISGAFITLKRRKK
ncbi:MAG: PEP-CTERM sorting domain-containing protein [Phycisphaerae bacterium]|nr:PEP-CTERM sorting domain-containing protein [Phycisphaerae bacterium]